MARARNIKPGLYHNEQLAECSVWARYIFPGLWMLADREGRLEDRPKRIKGDLLPYDTQDVEPLLRELAEQGFLERYEVDGVAYIQISKFSKHQTPHYSEKPSVIKPPQPQEKEQHISTPISRSDRANMDAALLEHSGSDRANMDAALLEHSGKHNGIKRGSQPPDSLNPDSLNPDSNKRARTDRNGRRKIPPPDDWLPSEASICWCFKELGLLSGDVSRYVEAFKDACRSNGYVYLDFDAAFKNCVRSDWPKLRGKDGKIRQAPSADGELKLAI